MTVNSIQNNSIGNNVIPSAPSGNRKSATTFCAEPTGDSFEPSTKKDSFLYRNRGTFGFFGASFLGEMATLQVFSKQLEGAGIGKNFLYTILPAIATGMVGQYLTEKLWNHDK